MRAPWIRRGRAAGIVARFVIVTVCESCDRTIEDGAAYCPYCGEAQASRPRLLQKAVAVLLLLAMLLFVVVAVLR